MEARCRHDLETLRSEHQKALDQAEARHQVKRNQNETEKQ